jgi:hypothetical protein
MTESYEDWESDWKARQKYANEMNDRIRNHGVESIGLDENDWVILRLIFLLYKEGRHASTPEAQRVVSWFNKKHPGYGQEIMLAAFSRLAGEARLKGEQSYEPFWKGEGKWE